MLRRTLFDVLPFGDCGRRTSRAKRSRPTDRGPLAESKEQTFNEPRVLDPGGEHEMITMIHADGDALVLTHYCMLSNQ
jgi:hypothetical protein